MGVVVEYQIGLGVVDDRRGMIAIEMNHSASAQPELVTRPRRRDKHSRNLVLSTRAAEMDTTPGQRLQVAADGFRGVVRRSRRIPLARSLENVAKVEMVSRCTVAS